MSPAGVEQAEDYQICANVAGLDVLISGHDHNVDPIPIVVPRVDGGQCLALNGGAYGAVVGRLDLTVVPRSGQPPEWDAGTQTLLPVDDTTVPDPEFAAQVDDFVARIEASGGSPSYLENLISRVEGASVTDDPATPGDLYFHLVGQTTFAVTDDILLNYLSADAMLTATDALGIHTDMALESAGMIRANIFQGQTGNIAVADAFTVVPLGNSPVDHSSIGYPLMRANLIPFYVRALFEFVASQGPTNSDFRMGQAGVLVTYDKTRPPAENQFDLVDPAKGQVVLIEKDTDHTDGFDQYDTLVYDRAQGYESPDDVSVVTSTYIGQFADQIGATLTDDNGNETDHIGAMLHRPDQSELKQLEAFMTYLYTLPGGTLPEMYNASSPNVTDRQVCIAGCN
jgi:2',3'-cyclic-nucleotide 2'-phosphodiesterase (5'-nucleotidase family)